MDYQIWTKAEYGDDWHRQDAADKAVVKRILLEELKAGRAPILTVEVDFSLQLTVGDAAKQLKKAENDPEPPAGEKQEEGAKGEADQDPAEQD